MTGAAVANAVLTLAVGAAGCGLGFLLHLPAPFLTGPSVLVTVACLAGLRLSVPQVVRDAAFIIIGINIGSGVTPDVADVLRKWPVAIFALFLMLNAILLAGTILTRRMFGYDRKSAVLATAPGHLSFVLSMGTSIGADVRIISIVQSIRVLALTLIVPFSAMLAGLPTDASFLFAKTEITPQSLAVLILASVLLGLVFRRIRVPAPYLMAAMVLSAASHVTGVAPGVLPPWMAIASFTILGTLIGTRFSGVTPALLAKAASAGAALTIVAVGLAALFAWPVWTVLDMPPSQVLIAFAPGGLETMVTMGAIMGADPNFVAAHHVGRLFILAVLIPLWVGRQEDG